MCDLRSVMCDVCVVRRPSCGVAASPQSAVRPPQTPVPVLSGLRALASSMALALAPSLPPLRACLWFVLFEFGWRVVGGGGCGSPSAAGPPWWLGDGRWPSCAWAWVVCLMALVLCYVCEATPNPAIDAGQSWAYAARPAPKIQARQRRSLLRFAIITGLSSRIADRGECAAVRFQRKSQPHRGTPPGHRSSTELLELQCEP
jgi:hypothetical protein